MTESYSGSPDEKPRVLVVDDERLIRDVLASFLTMEGYEVETAEDGAVAIEELGRARFDVVVSDLKMPHVGGLDLLRRIAASWPDTLTVIMTGFGTVETAIDAMKQGAYDYILKPFKIEEVVHVVRRGVEARRLAAENLRLREALSLFKVSEAIAGSLSVGEVMTTLTQSAFGDLHADSMSIWLEDGMGEFDAKVVATCPELESVATPGTLDPARIKERLTSGAPLIEQGARAGRFYAEPPSPPVTSLAIAPLRVRDRLAGFISVASVSHNKRFDEGQRKLLSIIASRAAAALENARLYENLQDTFQQTIQGLARTIDKMDRYTAGHSERVARYAVALARTLQLPERDIDIVRHSALMHDIGKLGCSINLNKPGRLTVEEYETFKRHPTYGREILEPIKFLGPVIPGVHLHHERWDGRGYPLRLVGEAIPLMARIIAVADTYDAMTSDRAYRRAVPHDVTIAEIEHCAGTQFDPTAAAAFVSCIERCREEWRDAGIEVPE
jgi:putative nucleotidyltransferase with HDIG domain